MTTSAGVRAAASRRLARRAPPHALAYSAAAWRMDWSVRRALVQVAGAGAKVVAQQGGLGAGLPAGGAELRGQGCAVAGVIGGHLQGHAGQDDLQLAGLSLVVDGPW